MVAETGRIKIVYNIANLKRSDCTGACSAVLVSMFLNCTDRTKIIRQTDIQIEAMRSREASARWIELFLIESLPAPGIESFARFFPALFIRLCR
jgi:hypothetical protein